MSSAYLYVDGSDLEHCATVLAPAFDELAARWSGAVSVSAVFCAIYRWRPHPGAEQTFVQAWSRITQLLVTEQGLLGSRLHRGPDNVCYSYTQWPSIEAKIEGLARPSVDTEAWHQLREAIAESLPELILEPVSDFFGSASALRRLTFH